MTDTVCVIALDAADYRLVKDWGLNNLLLEKHRPIETFAWSKDQPYTPEVWSTVATGVSPANHGIGETTQEIEWDNPLLRLASRITQYLPHTYRIALGAPFRDRGASRSMQTIGEGIGTPFDATLSWPGLPDEDHLRVVWKEMDRVNRGVVTPTEVETTLYGYASQELGWLQGLATREYALIGTHIHLLDAAGHIHCQNQLGMREMYEWMDEQIGKLRQVCDRLVLLSDHGMQVDWKGDDSPGGHSWDSYIATQGLDEPLPGDVYDVRAYLETVKPKGSMQSGTVSMDTPTKQLQDLGYIE